MGVNLQFTVQHQIMFFNLRAASLKNLEKFPDTGQLILEETAIEQHTRYNKILVITKWSS